MIGPARIVGDETGIRVMHGDLVLLRCNTARDAKWFARGYNTAWARAHA
jgi:hypothetical protein